MILIQEALAGAVRLLEGMHDDPREALDLAMMVHIGALFQRLQDFTYPEWLVTGYVKLKLSSRHKNHI